MQRISLPDIVSLMRQRIFDCAVFMIILLVGWVYTLGIEHVIDIGLYDESNYLHCGLLIPKGFPAAENAPLYALWYYALSLLQKDTIELYFLNYKLMTILPPLVLFVTLRAYSVSRILSLVLSFTFLFVVANFPTWPKVSHFTVLVLLSGFFLSSFVRDRKLQTAVLVITTFFASYIRPEYFIAFMCLTVLLVLLTFQDFRRTYSLKVATPLLATLLPCIVVALWFGVPMGSGNRSFVAFGQHYALNWVRWEGDARNPWTTWATIVANDFGDAASPFQALLANPSAVARHIFHNLGAFPGELKYMFVSTYPISSPAHIALKFGILILAFAGLAHIRRGTLTVFCRRIRDNLVSFRFFMILLFLAILPVGISIVLIAPRGHYVYIFGVLCALGVVVLCFRETGENKEDSSYLVTALLCIAVLMITRPLSDSLPAHPQLNLKTIMFLRNLNIETPVDILEAEGGYGIYLGENYNRVPEEEKNTPFVDFLTKRSIDMVVLSPRLAQDVRFREDPQWYFFTNDPRSFGFSRMTIPHVDERSLFVKREIYGKE